MLMAFSCSDSPTDEKILHKCITDSGVNIFTENISEFNLAEFLERFEQILQKEGVLSIANKDTYICLLKKLSNDSIYARSLFVHVSKKMPEAELILSPSNFYAILGCFDTYYANNTDTTSVLYKEYIILKTLLTEDTNPQDNGIELLEQMINTIDDLSFKKSIYRLPILPFVYLYIEQQYIGKNK